MTVPQALFGTAVGLVCATAVPAAESIRVERNVFIEMQDDVRLATDLYLPTTPGDRGSTSRAVISIDVVGIRVARMLEQ